MFLLLLILLGYGLVVWAFPKGNYLQEGLCMPAYWLRTLFVSTRDLSVTKHQYGTHPRQYLLHFCPVEGQPERPIYILYFHGGGWRFGRPEWFKSNAKVFTERGFHVVMPAYRPCPRHNYTHIRADINALLTYLKTLELPEQIIVGGMSAGGNVAAHILYDNPSLQKVGYTQNQFVGIFLCGAPLDLAAMRDSFVVRDFAGARGRAMFVQANPITHIDRPPATPICCIHGTQDGLVAYASAENFIQKIRSKGVRAITFYTLPKGTHLDSGSWAYSDNEVRRKLLGWLEKVVSQRLT